MNRDAIPPDDIEDEYLAAPIPLRVSASKTLRSEGMMVAARLIGYSRFRVPIVDVDFNRDPDVTQMLIIGLVSSCQSVYGDEWLQQLTDLLQSQME